MSLNHELNFLFESYLILNTALLIYKFYIYCKYGVLGWLKEIAIFLSYPKSYKIDLGLKLNGGDRISILWVTSVFKNRPACKFPHTTMYISDHYSYPLRLSALIQLSNKVYQFFLRWDRTVLNMMKVWCIALKVCVFSFAPFLQYSS